jgi:hypothetical protein
MAGTTSATTTPQYPAEPPTEPVAAPPEHWPPLTAAPRVVPTPKPWTAVVFAWLGAVVATVGSIGPWARYVDGAETTGLEHGDGWVVLAVGLAIAAITGALACGWRHRAARVGLLVASAALFFVYGLNRLDVGRARDLVTGGPVSVGGGLFAVALAGCLVLVGALVIPPRARDDAARRA